MIYFDHNATGVLLPEVKNFMVDNLGVPMNSSSSHSYGMYAKSILENTRMRLASCLGVVNVFDSYRIVFTSSGTEANNLIMLNYLDADIFVSVIEHSSILNFQKCFANIFKIRVDYCGCVCLHHLEKLLLSSKKTKKLVSIIYANNETGILQPMKEIVKIAHKFNAEVHSDCVQVLGRVYFNLLEMDLDYVTVSAHKCGGPIGVGALVFKIKHLLNPILIGGGQEYKLRSGTENVLAIGGWDILLSALINDIQSIYNKVYSLRNKIEDFLINNYHNIIIVGYNKLRLSNTILFINPMQSAMSQIILLDLNGIAVSSGSSCISSKIGGSYVLKSMGYSDKDINSAIRISIGYNNTESDVEYFMKVYNKINQC